MLQKLKVTSLFIITLFIVLILPISALSQKEVFSKDGLKGLKVDPIWNPPPLQREQSLVEEGDRSDMKKVADPITTGGLSSFSRTTILYSLRPFVTKRMGFMDHRGEQT